MTVPDSPDAPGALLSTSDISTMHTGITRDDPQIAAWMRTCPSLQTSQRPAAVDVPSDVLGALIRCTTAAQKLVRHVTALADVTADDRRVANAALHAVECQNLLCPARAFRDDLLARLIWVSTTEQRMQLATLYPLQVRCAELLSHATGYETVRAMAGRQ